MDNPSCQSACCIACPWLYDYHFDLGKLRATFIQGPITGYFIMGPTTLSINECLGWTVEEQHVTDCDVPSLYGGSGDFWCERDGLSDQPLRFAMTLGNGDCEGGDGEMIFVECLDPGPGQTYGTLTLRQKYVLQDLLADGCDECGGQGTVIIVEVTLDT